MAEMLGKDLVDEYENLNNLKKDIDIRIENLRKHIEQLAVENNTDKLIGSNVLCSINEYDKIVYPKDKENLIRLIKEKGIYDQVSSINYLLLNLKINKRNIDQEIMDLIELKKAFRISLKKL